MIKEQFYFEDTLVSNLRGDNDYAKNNFIRCSSYPKLKAATPMAMKLRK